MLARRHTLRSFPRKRESRTAVPVLAAKNWVPASAGMNGKPDEAGP